MVRDKKNDTSHEFSEEVGETDQEFVFNFKVENIKIIPGTYDVVISSKLLSEFTNKNTVLHLKYYVITAYFIILHVNVPDSIPYAWDVVIMLIAMSKLLS